MKLDVKRFKHVCSDEKTTTLESPDGHRITLAHKALGGAIKAQIEALAKSAIKAKVDSDEDDKKKKKYGKVQVKDTEDRRVGKVTVKDDETEDYGKVKMMAEGGFLDDITPDVMSMPAMDKKSREDMDAKKERERSYNFSVADQQLDPTGMPVNEGAYFDKAFGPQGEAPKDFQPDVYRNVMEQQADKAQDAQMQSVISAQQQADKIRSDNEARIAAGLEPLPVPDVPGLSGAPAPEQAQAPQQMPQVSPGQDPMAMLQGGYNKQVAGINAQAKAQGELGDQQAKILQDQQVADQQAMKAYDETRTKLQTERDALLADIQDGQINPDKFWTGDAKTGNGGHSKIAAGIGMILAGFNPTNSPNAVINYLKFQMEQNLQAQAKNLSSKENLLAANLQQFGELRSAMEMTRIMQNDILANQLQTAAAKAATPMAKAAALQAAGKLQADNAAHADKFYKAQTIRNIENVVRQDPSKTKALISALRAVDPERAKEMEQREVPGLGFASSLEGAKDLREMQATAKTVKSDVKRLQDILKTTGKSLSPTLRAEADSIRTRLIGRLRVPMTGPGAMSEGERELLMGLIPDVTSMTSLDARSAVRLKSLEKSVLDSYRNMATANGLAVPAESPSGGDDRMAQARAWLAANPNHPDAARVRKALGGK